MPTSQLMSLLPDGGVDVGRSGGHGAHASFAPEGALLGPLRGQRAPGLRLAELEPRQDGPPEQSAFPLPLEKLGLAVRRQHEASAGHGGAAAAAARAAHGHAGGERAGDGRRAGNHRSGSVQQSRAVAVLRTGAQ